MFNSKFQRSRLVIRGNKTTIKKLSNRPVSILKPLKGADKNLHMNLESFFTMNYDNYELLFCVEDTNDPAILIVQSLIKVYPKVDAQLIVGGSNVGINPKVNNIHPGYERSKYDLIMISDDKMLIQPYTLQEMVNKISSNMKIGIVAQFPSVVEKRDFSGMLDRFIWTFQSILPSTSNVITMNIHIPGMSALYEKKMITEAGGLKTFGAYLLEDVSLAKYAFLNGWKLEYSRYLGLQNFEDSGFTFQLKRADRWCKLWRTDSMKIFLKALFLL